MTGDAADDRASKRRDEARRAAAAAALVSPGELEVRRSTVVPSRARRSVWLAGVHPRTGNTLARSLETRGGDTVPEVRQVPLVELADALARAGRLPDLLILRGAEVVGIARDAAPTVPILEVVDGDGLSARLAAFRRGARAALPADVDSETLGQEVWGLLGGVDMVRSTTLGTASLDDLALAISAELRESVTPGRPPSGSSATEATAPPNRSMLRLGPGRRIAEAVEAFISEVREVTHSVPPPPPVPAEALAGRRRADLPPPAPAVPEVDAVRVPPDTPADEPGPVGRGDGSFLTGLRLFYVGADPGRADAFARVARRWGADLVLAGPRAPSSFDRASRQDPQAVVVDIESLDDEQVEVVRRLQQDPRLRWAPLCPLRWSELAPPAGVGAASIEDDAGDIDLRFLEARIVPLLAGELELRRRLGDAGADDPVEARLETLGFGRLLRTVAAGAPAGPRRLRLDRGIVQAVVELADDRVRGARWAQTAPSALTLEGDRALSAMLTLREGLVAVIGEAPELPATIDAPVPLALERAAACLDEVTPLLPTSSYRSATHAASTAPVIDRRGSRRLPLAPAAVRRDDDDTPGMAGPTGSSTTLYVRGEPRPGGPAGPPTTTASGQVTTPGDLSAPAFRAGAPGDPDVPPRAIPDALEDATTEPRVTGMPAAAEASGGPSPTSALSPETAPAKPEAGSGPPPPTMPSRPPAGPDDPPPTTLLGLLSDAPDPEEATPAWPRRWPSWTVPAALAAGIGGLGISLVLGGILVALFVARGRPDADPERAAAPAPSGSAPVTPPTTAAGSDRAGAEVGVGTAPAPPTGDDLAAAKEPAAKEEPSSPPTNAATFDPPIPPGSPRTSSDRMRRHAESLAAAGELAKAERTLEVAFEVHPGNPHVAADLARLYLDTDRAADALPWVEAAVRLRPRRARYRLLRGDCLAALGDGDGARDAWAKAARMDRRLQDAVAARRARSGE